MSTIDSNKILTALLFVALIGISTYSYVGKQRVKEKYQEVQNWTAFAHPASVNLQSQQTPGAQQLMSAMKAMENQPLTDVRKVMSLATPSYATMGGADGAYTASDAKEVSQGLMQSNDPRMPSKGLSNEQVNKILANKFGRGTGSEQDYLDPKQLLPTANMKKILSKDPSQSSTFMYDRYLTAPLKRRHGKVNVDFFRGDIPIQQVRTGWFDVAPVARQDLQAGYFSDYLDIQQSTSIKDATFGVPPTPVQEVSPWGTLGSRTVNSAL